MTTPFPPDVIENYNVGYLHQLATHMTKGAADRTQLTTTINDLATSQVWGGLGRIGQAEPLATHAATAETGAAATSATATEATAAAEALFLQKQSMVFDLNIARAAQLGIGSDYTLTDPLKGTPAGRMRAGFVKGLEAKLKTGAQTFTETEHATAQAIHTSMNGVGGMPSQPAGHVEVFGPDEGPNYAVEHQPDGSIRTIQPAIPAMGGDWPDAAKNGEGHISMVDNKFKTDGGGYQAPWNPAYGPPPTPQVPRPDGSLPMPKLETPTDIINNHGGQTPMARDPRVHTGTTKEIVDGIGNMVIGGGIEAGGLFAAPATGGASLIGSVPAGARQIYDGLEDLSRLDNLGRIPGSPPIIGEDGPGS